MKATINNIEKIARENGLELIQTTSGMNGYPQNIMYAVIGFDNFNKLDEFRSNFSVDRGPEIFTKKDGWKYWERTGNAAYEEFDFSAEEYGDIYSTFDNPEEEFILMKEQISECQEVEEIKNLLSRYEELISEYENKADDEVVVTRDGEYFETVKYRSMSTYHDTRSHVIGVLIERDNRMDDLELNEGDTTFWYDEVTHQCVSLEITEGIYEEIINGEYMDFENIPDQVLDALTSEVKASGYSIDDYTGAVYIDNGNNEGHYYLVW